MEVKPAGRPRKYCSTACKDRSVYIRNRDKVLERQRRYNLNNKDKIAERNKKLKEKKHKNKQKAVEFLGGKCANGS